MTSQTKTTLKTYFNTGDQPTEAQFGDFIDTLHRTTSFLVAASDASALVLSYADYVCDGTNDEVQIQAAIDALPAGGGRVLLSEGTFTCAKVAVFGTAPMQGYCILIDENAGPVLLEGSGWATIVKMADSQDADTSLFLIRGTDTNNKRTSATVLRDMKIDGNLTGMVVSWDDFAVVEVAYAFDVSVDNCHISDAPWFCFRSFRESERVYITGCYVDGSNGKGGVRFENKYGVISGNYITAGNTAGNGAGIDLSVNSDVGVASEFISIQNNVIDGGYTQVSLSGARHCSLFGNMFANSTDNSGTSLVLQHFDGVTDYSCLENTVIGNVFENIRQAIQLHSGGNGDLSNLRNIIANNVIIDGSGVNLANGIFESGTNVDNNQILDNVIQGATTAITKVGTSTIVRGNLGYLTENHGAAGSVADGGTIAHGLATTPTVAVCTPSVASEFVSVTALDGTNITVAIKQDDGTAGTSQTIYWRAYV